MRIAAEALHRRKSELFREMLAARPPALRPGVAETMALARGRGLALGLVTATSKGNVAALLSALGLSRGGFSTLVHAGRIARPKPAPDAYLRGLGDLGLPPAAALAVEDNPDGAAAALAAGLSCVALPGALHGGSTFPPGVERQAALDLSARLGA